MKETSLATLFECMRDRTRVQHEALHEVVDTDWMIQSVDNYRRTLNAYRSAISPLERQSWRFLDQPGEATAAVHSTSADSIESPDWASRLCKTQWLEQDLRWCENLTDGLGDDSSPINAANDHAGSLEGFGIDDWARFVGANYVTEGMTLGAQGMWPMIQEQFGWRSTDGIRFFHAYGDQTGRQWNQMKRWGNSLVCDIDLACDTAAATFDHFRECLARK